MPHHVKIAELAPIQPLLQIITAVHALMAIQDLLAERVFPNHEIIFLA
jgi:hypothetical protein